MPKVAPEYAEHEENDQTEVCMAVLNTSNFQSTDMSMLLKVVIIQIIEKNAVAFGITQWKFVGRGKPHRSRI